MKICIFGVSGFIGSSLKNSFSITWAYCDSRHIKVTYSQKEAGLDIYGYRHFKNLRCAALLADVDVVYYMCSPNQVECEANPESSASVVLDPLISILRAKDRIPNTRLVYFSTVQIFNSLPKEHVVDDDSVAAPNNYYGLFHVFAEQMIDLYKKRLGDKDGGGATCKLFGFYATVKCLQVPAVNEFIHAAAQNGNITLRSDGSPVRDFIEMAHLMNFCEQLAKAEDLPDRVLCASGVTVNLSFLVRSLRTIFQEEYGTGVKIVASSKMADAVVSEKPRFWPTSRLIKKTGIDQLQADLRKSIVDYWRFVS